MAAALASAYRIKRNRLSLRRRTSGRTVYAYVGGNPISNIDPLGLRALTDCEKNFLDGFFPKTDLSKIDFSPGPVPSGSDAITFGNQIYVRGGLDTPNSPATITLLSHEISHSADYATFGFANFLGAYVGGYFMDRMYGGMSHDQAYRDSYTERQAFKMEKRVQDALKGFDSSRCGCQ